MTDGPGDGEPSENRIREAVAVGVNYLVVACPKDFVMYTEAVKTTGNSERIKVLDLIELVDQARRRPAPVLETV